MPSSLSLILYLSVCYLYVQGSSTEAYSFSSGSRRTLNFITQSRIRKFQNNMNRSIYTFKFSLPSDEDIELAEINRMVVNGENDGWDDPTDQNDDSGVKYTTKPMNKFEAYAAERESILSANNSRKRNVASAKNESTGERDFFIPAFAIVSIIGFAGAYGYETLRLYLNGDLYLPFQD